MDNNNESKAERFIRVAEPRVGRACKAISLIGNFATGDYEYTEQQVMRCLPRCRRRWTRRARSIARVRKVSSGF